MREKIINTAVQHLKDMGYPNVTAQNIFTDRVYSAFFLEMLKDAMGMVREDPAIKIMISEIQAP